MSEENETPELVTATEIGSLFDAIHAIAKKVASDSRYGVESKEATIESLQSVERMVRALFADTIAAAGGTPPVH